MFEGTSKSSCGSMRPPSLHLLEDAHPDRQRHLRPLGSLADRLRLQVVADPDADRVAGRHSDEPRVGEVVRRPGLPGDVELQGAGRGRPVPRWVTPFEHLQKLKRRLGALDLARVRVRLLEQVAVGVRDSLDHVGGEGEALVGEDGIGRGQLEEGDLEGAERHRRVGLELLPDAEAVRRLDDVARARPSRRPAPSGRCRSARAPAGTSRCRGTCRRSCRDGRAAGADR